MAKIEKGLDYLSVFLHLVSLFSAGQTKNMLSTDMDQVIDLAKQGKYKEAGQLIAKKAGEGFADEDLHSRSARRLPSRKKEYLAFLKELKIKEPKIHTNYIIGVATESDEKERDKMVQEFADCANYDEFRDLIDSYGLDQPQTPQQKMLATTVEKFEQYWPNVRDFVVSEFNDTQTALRDMHTELRSGVTDLETYLASIRR